MWIIDYLKKKLICISTQRSERSESDLLTPKAGLQFQFYSWSGNVLVSAVFYIVLLLFVLTWKWMQEEGLEEPETAAGGQATFRECGSLSALQKKKKKKGLFFKVNHIQWCFKDISGSHGTWLKQLLICSPAVTVSCRSWLHTWGPAPNATRGQNICNWRKKILESQNLFWKCLFFQLQYSFKSLFSVSFSSVSNLFFSFFLKFRTDYMAPI